MPRPSPIAVASEPMSRELPVPLLTLVKMSRPDSSVPNQCSAEGAFRTSVQLVAIGS